MPSMPRRLLPWHTGAQRRVIVTRLQLAKPWQSNMEPRREATGFGVRSAAIELGGWVA